MFKSNYDLFKSKFDLIKPNFDLLKSKFGFVERYGFYQKNIWVLETQYMGVGKFTDGGLEKKIYGCWDINQYIPVVGIYADRVFAATICGQQFAALQYLIANCKLLITESWCGYLF